MPTFHVSDAMKHLRGAVTVMCWVLGLALMVQVLTWAFVHYTDLRFEELQAKTTADAPAVVHGSESDEPAVPTPQGGPDVNLVLSRYDVWFRVQHHVAAVVGMVALVVVVVQMMTATMMAAGAAAPGVASLASGQTMALALLGLMVPWGVLVPDLPYPGLFTTYSRLCREVGLSRIGSPEALEPLIYYGRYLILPLAATVATAVIGVRFRWAVEASIIVVDPAAIDPTVEAEARDRRASSLAAGSGRTQGALRSAMAPAAPPPPKPLTVSGSAGDSLRRPI